jgi:hypothetical protein
MSLLTKQKFDLLKNETVVANNTSGTTEKDKANSLTI